MRIVVASGDCGAFSDGVYGDLSVSFPASNPWATSVGGTILNINGQQSRENEIAWSDGSDRSSCKNRWGSGGRNSQPYSRQAWQDAHGVFNHFSVGNHRQSPHVSALPYDPAVSFHVQYATAHVT